MTQIQDEQALLPCPFCGSGDDPKLDIFHTMPSGEQSIAVTCMDCGGRGPVTIEPYRGECESEWNTRSLPALIAAAKGMGYAVVPLEPSGAMQLAGWEYTAHELGSEECAELYRVMITASQGRG